jgi:hypothetical protein
MAAAAMGVAASVAAARVAVADRGYLLAPEGVATEAEATGWVGLAEQTVEVDSVVGCRVSQRAPAAAAGLALVWPAAARSGQGVAAELALARPAAAVEPWSR